MRRSENVTRCACGEPLPARYGKGGKPKKCEGCKQADRARRERERRRRRAADKDLASQEHAAPCWSFPRPGGAA